MITGTGRRALAAAPADIAARAAEFLLGPAAGFVSGTDPLVDGGVVAAGATRPPG